MTEQPETPAEHYTREYYIGEEALQLRGVLRLNYPIGHGIVEDKNTQT